MVGADFVPAEGYGDPLRGTMALLRLAQAHGARLLRGAEVRAIERDGAGWSVTTSKGVVRAGRVVNATGPWAAAIGRMVGLRPAGDRDGAAGDRDRAGAAVDAASGGDGQPASVAEAAGERRVPDRRRLVRRLRSGERADAHVAAQHSRAICGSAARALPALRALSILRSWTGINPAIDRAPLLGEAPGLPGFFNAVTANGYTLGPVVGQMTAAAILAGEAIDPRYRVERFDGPRAG